jgi:mycobactin lysine-N-oxygenase
MPAQRLAIIGGGPKAAAIAAKASCLRDLADLPIEVAIFEQHEIGSAWSGRYGYTDGQQRLCTPAERDVGFPYDSQLAQGLGSELQVRFSWMAYAISNGTYGDWVDRGRPKPTHREFADYIAWCIDGKAPVYFGEVTALKQRSGRWSVTYRDVATGLDVRESGFDGVVVTGPGPQAKRLPQVVDPRIFDGVSLWLPGIVTGAAQLAAQSPDDPVIIVGSGGTAAATAAALVRAQVRNEIIVLGNQAALYARADSYFENRAFRDPKFWSALSAEDRRAFSDRLTRGAVWSNVVDLLAQVNTIDYLQGEAIEIRHDPVGDPTGALMVDYRTSADPDGVVIQPAAIVIDATGFDPWWFRSLLSTTLAAQTRRESEMRSKMASDLSLPLDGAPRLHVPMVSQAVGPAYNSLMALGTLSDVILRPYVEAALT